MDDVKSYLMEARRETKRLFAQGRGTMSSVMPAQACSAPPLECSSLPRLPPKKKRCRSADSAEVIPSLPVAPVTSSTVVRPVVAVVAPSSTLRMLQAIRLLTPTVARQHLPTEQFAKPTLERFTLLRERLVSMRMMVRERHGDRKELVNAPRDGVVADLVRTQHGLRSGSTKSLRGDTVPDDTHYFDLPLAQPLGQWFRYLELNGPLEGILSRAMELDGLQFTPTGFNGLPATTMLSLASDGDLNNLFCAVLTKVVRGAKEGRYELSSFSRRRRPHREQTSDQSDESDADKEVVEQVVPSRISDLRNVAWLFAASPPAPAWAEVSVSPISEIAGLDDDVRVFVRSLCPFSVRVDRGGEWIRSEGYGPWVYTALASVELPLDPSNERLLQQLFQLVCRSITSIRGGGHEGALTGERKELLSVSLCCLDTLLVVLCRYFQLNNKDLVPL